MRKLLLTLTTSVIGLGLMGGVASASSVTCNGSISNTGANSNNTVNCVDTNNVSVTCSNNETIVEGNNQTSTSGSATNSGNTSSGNATSGSSNNSNSVTVQLGGGCAPVAGSTTAFTTSAVSAPASTSTPAAAAATPTTLPNTGSNSALDAATVGLGALAGVSLVSAGAVTLKRHLSK